MANQREKNKQPASAPSQGEQPASRRERRANQIRQQRAERQQAAARAQRRRQIGELAAVIVVLLIVSAVVVVIRTRTKPSGAANSVPTPVGVQTFTNLARTHVDGHVTYAQNPPVGGSHNPVWQNCGFYAKPVGSEHAVHSLEHGAVWITYEPNLPADQVAILKRLAASQTYILVSPYPGLPAPVVASAWGKQLRLQSATDPRLDQFVRAFRLGPQTPELGAPCTGGTSATT